MKGLRAVVVVVGIILRQGFLCAYTGLSYRRLLRISYIVSYWYGVKYKGTGWIAHYVYFKIMVFNHDKKGTQVWGTLTNLALSISIGNVDTG